MTLSFSNMLSDVFRPLYRLGRPNSGAQKTLQVFFFRLYFSKKYVELAINYFGVHLIVSKWLRRQKCRRNRKTMRQRGRSEEETVQKCFHSFKYIIDHANVCFEEELRE